MSKSRHLVPGLLAIGSFYGAVLFHSKTFPPPPKATAISSLPIFDALIIGGGVIGLSAAQNLSSRGASVLLLEKDSSLAAGASSGNSGLGCTGYDAEVGSLERRLLRRSAQIHQNLYRRCVFSSAGEGGEGGGAAPVGRGGGGRAGGFDVEGCCSVFFRSRRD